MKKKRGDRYTAALERARSAALCLGCVVDKDLESRYGADGAARIRSEGVTLSRPAGGFRFWPKKAITELLGG